MAGMFDRGGEPSTFGTLTFLMWGLIVWGGQLTIVYVGHTWFCALGAPPLAFDLLVGGTTVAGVLLISPALLWPSRVSRLAGLDPRKGDPGHLIRVARYVALLSTIAVLWTGVTFFLVQSCALAR